MHRETYAGFGGPGYLGYKPGGNFSSAGCQESAGPKAGFQIIVVFIKIDYLK
jgi:hypothetical protein